ncbi:putative MO25-like protein [Hordeum vulgare]|nr:putative MO25-like protein [Hordeum vulgare]
MSPARSLSNGMPIPTPMVDDPDYVVFMENVMFEGHGEAFHVDGKGQAFDPDATQSEDDRGHYEDTHFTDDDEYDDDQGNSWHDDDDLYCEDEEEEVDISSEPLVFIDELTQRVGAQKRRQSIRTGSYTQLEDTLICESWMEIGQDLMKCAEQKRFPLLDESSQQVSRAKEVSPYQFASTRGINSIQKR